jgi:hypothetical protein
LWEKARFKKWVIGGAALWLLFCSSTKKSHVLVMAADPEPCNRILVKNAKGAISKGNSHGPCVLCMIDAFEVQRWVERVFYPQAESFFGGGSDSGAELVVPRPK